MADSGGGKVIPNSQSQEMLRNEVFVLRGFGRQILGVLNEWRNSKTYCDVNVSINDSNFSLHRCVLAAGSRKFHEILHSINPSSTACLSFDGMPTEGFTHVIDYLYTGRICLNHLLVKDVLKSARFLQVEEVANLCKLYLRRQYMPSDRSEVRVDVSAREQNNVKQAASEVIFELKEVFETPAPLPIKKRNVPNFANGFPEEGNHVPTPPDKNASAQAMNSAEDPNNEEANSMTGVAEMTEAVGGSPGNNTTVQNIVENMRPDVKSNLMREGSIESEQNSTGETGLSMNETKIGEQLSEMNQPKVLQEKSTVDQDSFRDTDRELGQKMRSPEMTEIEPNMFGRSNEASVVEERNLGIQPNFGSDTNNVTAQNVVANHNERNTEIGDYRNSGMGQHFMENQSTELGQNIIGQNMLDDSGLQMDQSITDNRNTEMEQIAMGGQSTQMEGNMADRISGMEQNILDRRIPVAEQGILNDRNSEGVGKNIMANRDSETNHGMMNDKNADIGRDVSRSTEQQDSVLPIPAFQTPEQAAETQVNQTLMDLAQAAIESYHASCDSPGPFSNISATDGNSNVHSGPFSSVNSDHISGSVKSERFSDMPTDSRVNNMDQGPYSVDNSTNNGDILTPRASYSHDSGSIPESVSRDGLQGGISDHESDSGAVDDAIDSGEMDRSSDSLCDDDLDNITVKVEEKDAFGLSELDSTGLTPSLLELLKKHALLQPSFTGKKRRGRPRKNPAPLRAAIKRPTLAPAAGKRKRGRPRKIPLDEMDLEPKQEIDDGAAPEDMLKEEFAGDEEESDMFENAIMDDPGSDLDFMLSSDEEYMRRKPRKKRGRKAKAKKVPPPLPMLPPGVVRRGRPRKGEMRFRGPKNCEKCKRMFEHSRDLAKHMEHHDNDQLTFCPICNWGFQRKGELTKHCRAHSGESYHCDDCDQDYINPREFKNHMLRLHDNPRPFFCKHPGCTFHSDRPSNVDNHAILHSGLKTVLCPQCGKAFAHPNSLYSHRKSCLQQRGYLCDICGSKFNHFQSLQSHRRLHTGEKPFWCHSCGKGFADRMNYKRHRRIHENLYPYPCPVCDKRFRHSNSLKAHMNRHNPGMAPAVVQAQPMPRVAPPVSAPPLHLQSQPQTPTQPQPQPPQHQHAQPHNMHIPHTVRNLTPTPTPTQSLPDHISPLFTMAHISHPHAPPTPTPITHPHPHPSSTPTPTHHHQSTMVQQPGGPHLHVVHPQAPMSPGPIPMNQHHMHHSDTSSPVPTPLPAHTPLPTPNYQRLMPVPVTSTTMGMQPYNPHNPPTSGTHPAMPVFNYGPPEHPFFPGMQAF